MANSNVTKPGRLLLIDSGEYSDYGVDGFFVVLREFDPLAKREEYLVANPDQREPFTFDRSGFIAFLISQGLLLEIDHDNLYLGSYSCCEQMRFQRGPTDG